MEDLPVGAIRLALMLLITIIIAVVVRIAGMLLTTSLLIIPAAAAWCHARSPRQVAVDTGLLGLVAVCTGLALSWSRGIPTGPSIVANTTGLSLLSFALPRHTARNLAIL